MHRFPEVGCASLAWALLSLVPACSLPRGVTAISDGSVSPMDAFVSGIDVGPGHDAGPGDDAFAPDAWIAGNDAFVQPIDAFVPMPDAFVPPVDAFMPDAAMPPTCFDTFHNGLLNYTDCSSTSSSCTFYLVLGSGTSCDDICTMSGHTCTAAIDNNTTDHCTSAGGAQMCNHNLFDGICTCSFP